MRSALFFSCLLVLLVSTRAPAQSTLTLATVFPFDAQKLKPPYLEILLKHQQSPLSLIVSTLLTSQGWTEIKLTSEYKSSLLETSIKAELTPRELRGVESKWKLTLKDRLVGEGDLQMSAGRFKSSSVKLRLGPSALNISSSAKFVPAGLTDEKMVLNVSRSFAQGDLSGSTSFDRKGFSEQTLTISNYYLTDDWSLTMASVLTLQGLKSQAFELSTSWDLWSLSAGFTVTSRGPTNGSIALDGAFSELLVQISLEFSGLEWTGLQAMAFGSLRSLSLNLIAMLSSESLQMVTLDLSGPLWGWQAHVVLDLLWTDLSEIDFKADVGFNGELLGFSLENRLSLKFYELLSASVRIQRALSRWTGSFYVEFSSVGLENGSFTLERRWRL